MARTAHRSIGNEPCGLLPSLNHGENKGKTNGNRYRTLRRTQGVRRLNNSIDFSGPNAGKTISSWISKHTKGLLHPALECDGTELLSIISTVFADSRWKTPFEINDTEPAVFHGDRGDATVPFMHQWCEDVSYLCDETFGWECVDIPFDDGSELRIVLPGTRTLETLANDPMALH